MTAISHAGGWAIEWAGDHWVYSDDGSPATTERPCKRCGRMPTSVSVKVPPDLSHTGGERWKLAKIDSCIADLVRALQEGGIDMRSSCCGHGDVVGNIYLQDGRVLLVLSPDRGEKYFASL